MQKAIFYGGIFLVTQTRGVVNLTLTEELARAPSAARRAAAAAKKPKTRKLWGDGHGAFQTTGKFSAATVRGTTWLVQDACDGTLTRVKQGLVRSATTSRRRRCSCARASPTWPNRSTETTIWRLITARDSG